MKRILSLIVVAWLSIPLFAASPGYRDTLVVASDGTGDYGTFTEAFEHCRAFMDYDVHILVKPGVYREKVVVPAWLQNIIIEGENASQTILTWDDHANLPAGGLLGAAKMGTFRTYTLRVDGSAITFRNLTIENAAPQLGQAVAVHTEGDRITFIGCRILGHQDTLYTAGSHARCLFVGCYIEGTTDFIFGPATAWFEECTIHCLRNSFITAASTPADVAWGYVFNHCAITCSDDVTSMLLGRPWRDHASTLFMYCDLGDRIAPAGWAPWDVPEPSRTVRYAEYRCAGTSADTSRRVSWARRLTRRQASAITPRKVLGDWIPQL